MWKLIGALVVCLSIGSAVFCSDYRDAATRAQELVKSGDRYAAAALLEQTIGDDANEEADWLRGSILIWRDAPPRQTLAQFLKVADCYPDCPNAARALIRVGHLRDRIGEDSRSDWQRVVRDYPGTSAAAQAFHCLGHQAIRYKDPELAIKMFMESVLVPNVDPAMAAESRVEAGYAHISLYWKTKDRNVLAKALETFASPMEKNDLVETEVRTRLGRGEVYLILGQGSEAVQEYQAALNASPSDPYLLGIAEFGLGCALYTKRDFGLAERAFTQFLEHQKGNTLTAKDWAWRQARPGYATYSIADPARAEALSGLELVPTAAYWRAACLVELKRHREAKQLLDGLSDFPHIRLAGRVKNLGTLCAHVLGEDR